MEPVLVGFPMKLSSHYSPALDSITLGYKRSRCSVGNWRLTIKNEAYALRAVIQSLDRPKEWHAANAASPVFHPVAPPREENKAGGIAISNIPHGRPRTRA